MKRIHQDIIDRYDAMLKEAGAGEPRPAEKGTDLRHLRWMLQQLREDIQGDKAHRWLGFIQGTMIAYYGLTTVRAERDFTRPYFTGAKL